ncbi:hypothetical protein SKAU_G00235970 [Synaphobranchus kaupii]|uniref:Reverse transcriptase/retrotransposon-derived protein RNase H-like domain-containing protein n=1 Tax=Synaphobranchus kaupii TaxID=118154 RepID=A0A9Q1ITU8_SYNKA|nr:hypothetical protein SKAU_G00235970 [Synaphobranchus kaupii]
MSIRFSKDSWRINCLFQFHSWASLWRRGRSERILLKFKPSPIGPNRPHAQQAFDLIKTRFSTAPILCHPDPDRQFVAKVDASDTSVGAVLSQRAAQDSKLHPCAYFSRRLTPAERNYDVGDRESLAIKLALEEWRHWLEGAGKPFFVLTNHWNLLCIKSAKRLNSHQARWSLFFARFNFTVTFRPGSRNVKPDALSRVFSPHARSLLILSPSSCVVAAVSWEIEGVVKAAQATHPDPRNNPNSCLFVSNSVRSQVLQWAHASRLACHPGIARTTALVRRSFWWPTLKGHTRAFVLACHYIRTAPRLKISMNQPCTAS